MYYQPYVDTAIYDEDGNFLTNNDFSQTQGGPASVTVTATGHGCQYYTAQTWHALDDFYYITYDDPYEIPPGGEQNGPGSGYYDIDYFSFLETSGYPVYTDSHTFTGSGPAVLIENDWIQLGVTEATGSGNCTPGPNIKSISPSRSVVNRTVSATLTGKHFGRSGTVSVSGSGVTAATPTAWSDSSITVNLTIDATATQGNRDIRVTTNSMTSDAKQFLVQVPYELEVFADTGNVDVSACTSSSGHVQGRVIQYKIDDSGGNEIKQSVSFVEGMANMTTNTCGNGSPSNPGTLSTILSSGTYVISDSIAITGLSGGGCSPTALSGCSSNPSCGYEYDQTWSTSTPDGSIELEAAPDVTHCNLIKVNNATTLSKGTIMPR